MPARLATPGAMSCDRCAFFIRNVSFEKLHKVQSFGFKNNKNYEHV